jgi:phospholipid/cholesterol/gamma-HCH transport system substrate-binding protein
MENKSHATAAGLFVVLALALVVALAAWLSRDMGARRMFEISTNSIVTGLQPQAAVRFRGVSVGKVDSIGFDAATPGNVLIRLSVDAAAPITSTTFATLDLQGVTGLTYVQLDDRAPTGGPLTSSDAQPARIPLRAGLLATLSERGAEALTQLEATSERLTQLLSDANQKALVGSVQNIGQAAQDLSTLSKGLDTTVRNQLRPALASLPPLAQSAGSTLEALRASSGEIGQAANAAKQTVTEFGTGAKSLNNTLERLQAPGGAIDKLQDASAALAQSGQQLNQNTLPRVGRLASEGTRAAQALQRTAGDLSDNPQSLVWGNGTPPPGPGEPGFQAPAARTQP